MIKVNKYTKSDGTKVRSHKRSEPEFPELKKIDTSKLDFSNKDNSDKLNYVKQLYGEVDLKREFKPTKDGAGFYIHPKGDNFLKWKGKRVGIFVNYEESKSSIKQMLIEVDDEYRRKLEAKKEPKVKFYVDGKLNTSYSDFQGMAEIRETAKLLEHENPNKVVKVFVDGKMIYNNYDKLEKKQKLEKGKVTENKTSKKVNGVDAVIIAQNDIFKKYDIRSGQDLEGSLEKEFIKNFKKYSDKGYITEEEAEDLEEGNYHTPLKLLRKNKLVK